MKAPTLAPPDFPIVPAPLAQVAVKDGFWLPRLETNRLVSIPSVLRKCGEFGRVDNFLKAAGRLEGPYVGLHPCDDTEVYKAIEGASYCLARDPDPGLDAHVDRLVEAIAAAQEPDGYLYTNRTIDPTRVHPFAGPERWSSLLMSHELYNCGHLIEAGCAHFSATGKRTLLEVALRSAGLVCRTFGPAGRHDVPGHQIIEMALTRLYRITRDRRHLHTARFFLEQRGRHDTRPRYSYAGDPAYCQDHLPVLQQREAVGHAVRAAYMHCGLAEVAALLPDPAYAEASRAVWRDVMETKLYLTGGIGARHEGESFGSAYELPNRSAYAETCAAIGLVMWSHRLFLLSGDSRYYDTIERTLYNGLLSGVSLGGDEFFYVNPLETDGQFPFNHGSTARQPWFDVSCCPTNLCRFLPSLPGYIYAQAADSVFVNLYVASETRLETPAGALGVALRTEYPWQGAIRVTLSPERTMPLRLMLRVPDWARDRIMEGDLYRFESTACGSPSLWVNGERQDLVLERGYAVIERSWNEGDTVELRLPMPVRKVLCDERVADNRGKAALQRGPLVYCVEGRDAGVALEQILLGPEAQLSPREEPRLLGGLTTIRGAGFTAIPYYAWANRGAGPMRVWLGNGTR